MPRRGKRRSWPGDEELLVYYKWLEKNYTLPIRVAASDNELTALGRSREFRDRIKVLKTTREQTENGTYVVYHDLNLLPANA